jgi:hypothetical protein
MKHRSIVSLLLIFTLLGCFATGAKTAEIPAQATGPKIAEVSVFDIRPTQPAAGYAASEATQLLRFRNIRDEAALRDRVLQEKPLRAVVAPGGGVYLTDGHHRALAIYRTSAAICESSKPAAEVDPCMRGIKVRVRIDGDYSNSGWDEFVDALLKENNMYLPQTIRAKLASGELAKERIFKDPDGVMPTSLGKLANDPMRSAIGTLFHYQGISGDWFANYLEFLVSERIGGAVEVKAGHEFSPDVQIRLMKAIFGNENIVKFIRCLAIRDEKPWNEAQKAIDQAVGIDTGAPFVPEHCEAGK